jgi:hypothetical protein
MSDKTEFAKELEKTGLSVAEFCRITKTPYDTAQKWYSGTTKNVPAVVFSWMLLYRVGGFTPEQVADLITE